MCNKTIVKHGYTMDFIFKGLKFDILTCKTGCAVLDFTVGTNVQLGTCYPYLPVLHFWFSLNRLIFSNMVT